MLKIYGWPWLMVAKGRSLPDKRWSYGAAVSGRKYDYWWVRP